jgi:hypothetical protein
MTVLKLLISSFNHKHEHNGILKAIFLEIVSGFYEQLEKRGYLPPKCKGNFVKPDMNLFEL